MRLLALPDMHLNQRGKAPKRRQDDYHLTQQKKMHFIVDVATTTNCDYIVSPGDIFDSDKANDHTKQFWIRWIKKYCPIPILAVFGQHDMRWHNKEVSNTPLMVLDASETLVLMSSKGYEIGEGIKVYGANWGDPIPEPDETRINILVTHRMIIQDKKVWDGQGSFDLSYKLLYDSGFDLIISGDNHEKFTWSKDGKHLINAGSLMRSRKTQRHHEPAVFVWDSDENTIQEFLIPIQTFDEVMNMEEIAKEEEDDRNMGVFIEKIKEGGKPAGLNFKENVRVKLEDDAIRKELGEEGMQVVKEAMP